MKPGIYHDLPGDEYHSLPGYSSSFLKQCFKENLAKAKHSKFELSAEVEEVGHGVHTAALEGEKDLLVRGPDRRGTKEWNAAKLEAEYQGKILIKGKVLDQVRDMASALFAHPRCGEILTWEDKVCEASIFQEVDGLLCKIRPDIYSVKQRAMADVKTCQSSDPREFMRSAWSYGYQIQASFYMRIAREFGIEVDNFYFLTVEKKAPYFVHCHRLSEHALNYGYEVIERLLPIVKKAHDTDVWPTGWGNESDLDIPAWLQDET